MSTRTSWHALPAEKQMRSSAANVVLAATVVLLMLVLPPLSWGEDLDWKKGKLERLAPLIGTYRYDEVLHDSSVSLALDALLPTRARATLERNLDVVAPIDFIDGNLVLTGNRAHHGDEDTAAVWIKVYDGSVRVVLQEGGRLTLYANDRRYQYLPLQIRMALAMPNVRATLLRPPAYVAWKRERSLPDTHN